MSLLKFKNFLFGRKSKDPVKPNPADFALTRQNNEIEEVENKSWYHPDSDQHVDVESDSVYHTREVALNPHKFGITDETLGGFYSYRNSELKPDKAIATIRKYPNMDWSDEIVHGMHDRGWLRLNNNKTNKVLYIGGNSPNHIARAVKKLAATKVITPGYSVHAHVYGYGNNGFGGNVFKIQYSDIKDIR